jgi:hypothetical protein
MPGIDKNNQFPNSKMANAVRIGQSRFAMVETVASGALMAMAANASSGVFTLNTPGDYVTSTLLQAAGLREGFTSLVVTVETSVEGVTIAQGSGSAVYQEGEVASFGHVTSKNDPVTITLVEGDVVSVSYTGT